MGLQVKSVEEGSEERARREPEPPLEVGDEDNPFPDSRGWFDLARGTSAFDACGDPPGSPQPSNLGFGYLESLPSGTLVLLDIVVRGMARHDDSELHKQEVPR